MHSRANAPVRGAARRGGSEPPAPSLPPFDGWTPAWTAREDVHLCDALLMVCKTTLSQLGESKAEHDETLDELRQYMTSQKDRVVRRSCRDLSRRLDALAAAFGSGPQGLQDARRIASKERDRTPSHPAPGAAPVEPQPGFAPGKRKTDRAPPPAGRRDEPDVGGVQDVHPAPEPVAESAAAAGRRGRRAHAEDRALMEPPFAGAKRARLSGGGGAGGAASMAQNSWMKRNSSKDQNSSMDQNSPIDLDQSDGDEAGAASGAASGAQGRGETGRRGAPARSGRADGSVASAGSPAPASRAAASTSRAASAVAAPCPSPEGPPPAPPASRSLQRAPRARQAVQRLGVGDGFDSGPAREWGSAKNSQVAARNNHSAAKNSQSAAKSSPDAGKNSPSAAKKGRPSGQHAREGDAPATLVQKSKRAASALEPRSELGARGAKRGRRAAAQSPSSAAPTVLSSGVDGAGDGAAASSVEQDDVSSLGLNGDSSLGVDEAEIAREMRAAAEAAVTAPFPALQHRAAPDDEALPAADNASGRFTHPAAPAATAASALARASAARAAPPPSAASLFPLRDSDGFPVGEETTSALLNMARKTVYRRLLAPPTGLPAASPHASPHAGADLHSHLHAATRKELRSQLLRTAAGLETSSLLIVGPRGAGKHRMLASTLEGLRKTPAAPGDKHGGRHGGTDGGVGDACADFLVVDLSTLLMDDEITTLMAIAAQLGLTEQIQMKRFGSFSDGLRHLLHLLRRTRPGSQGEARREGQAQPVCFILHDFEAFALRNKQTFLYSLFDLCQTDDAQMAVIGLTSRVDAIDLLEKRVRSRFSGRQLLLGYLQNSADASTLVSRALAGAAPSPAAGSPLGRPPTPPGAGAGVASPGGGGVGAGLFGVDPAAVRGYAQWWGSAVTEMAESLCTSPTLERLLWQGLTPRMLLAGTKLHLSTLSISQPVPSARGIEHALTRRLQLPLPESMLPELSVVELLLLLCLKRRTDAELPPPHTLRAVLREYDAFLAAAPEAPAQYGLPAAPLTKAFEHLAALGLVKTSAHGGTHSGAGAISMDGTYLELTAPPHALEVFVAGSNAVPTIVKRFGAGLMA